MTREELTLSGYKEFSPGYYINRSGLVYSIKSKKFLALEPNLKGYMTTVIYVDGKRRRIYNHIRVVQMFGDKNGNRIYPGLTSLLDHGISIDHVDGDKLNCRQSNLELVAHTLNCQRYGDMQKEAVAEVIDELGF